MIRVKTAATLMQGMYNEMWAFIEDEAKKLWALIAT
jgi:hypothetical protein